MIVYADSSVLVRAYLHDENGHLEALRLLEDPDLPVVTGTWTRIEVAGALVRAARTGRGDVAALLAAWAADTNPNQGLITVISFSQAAVEERALQIVTTHAIRATYAWHVAIASLVVPRLADGEPYGFASRDRAQAGVAAEWGFVPV